MTSKYIARAQEIIKLYQKQTNFQRMAGNCRVLDADKGRIKVEFEVQEEHTNPVATMHGGYTATLIDILTTTALLMDGKSHGGVSIDLHVSYLAPAKIGDTVVIDSQVTKHGRTVAFTRADVYRKADDRLLATAMHTKSIGSLGGAASSKSHI